MTVMTKPPVMERTYMPLSHAQRAVWLDMRLMENRAAYQVGCLVEFGCEIDPDIARQAVRIMMARHDALRLRVDSHEPRQWIEPAGRPPFTFIDLSGDDASDLASQNHVRAVQAEGFALGETSLFRVDLMKIGPGRWRLLMLAHHLIADGVSIRLAQVYWLQAYKSLSGEMEDSEFGDGESLPEDIPHSSYAPVVQDDETYSASDRYKADLAYWTERLSPLPSLVFDDRPPAGVGEAEPILPIILDAADHAALVATARKANTTLHRALTAVIAIALSRRYRKNDFAIGMALHRRDMATRNVIGMLAGIIPLRVKLEHDISLSGAIEQLAAGFDSDLRHQRLPIDAIGRSLAASGAFADRPGRHLFDVAVTMMPGISAGSATLSGRPVSSLPLRSHEVMPLAIYVDEEPGGAGLAFSFGFDPTVLTGAEVSWLRESLADVLRAAVEEGTRPISSFDGMASSERLKLQAWCQGLQKDVPQETVPALFEAVVKRQPHALAVVGDDRELSFEALDQAANRVAHLLRQRDLPSGSTVAVCMERSIETVVLLLGILKADCVYLPLDPVYPLERLAGMITDSETRLVFTNAAAEARLPLEAPRLSIDDVSLFAGDILAAPERAALTPASRAYIIYTSGSTGRPKGVALSHGALVNLAYARLEHDPIGPGDRILAAISVGFDVSLGQLVTPLLAGACIAVAGDIRGISSAAFWEFNIRHQVSHINSVPSVFESILDDAPPVPSLKQVMLGGEPMSGFLGHRLQQGLGVRVCNIYGPTETCIEATAFVMPDTGMERMPVLPIGRPHPNYTTYVLDGAMRLVPIGSEGELYIGGAGLAEGYVNRPDLTLERFVEHRDYGRLYRTGDRVFWREDGTLFFLGRNDTQVKIRGFRIELGEIEAVLREHDGVGQAAVIVRKHGGAEPRILGYVVPVTSGVEPSLSDLRAFLERRLPSHMIPSGLMSLAALPLSTNGKLDARALPDPALSVEAGTPPKTPTEQLLAACFANLLGIEKINTQSHFFELGGHSLLATQLASKLREALGFELPIRTLFEAPRLGDLALRIDEMITGNTFVAAEGLRRQERPAVLPLSLEQERLWFLHKLDPQSPAYNIPIVLQLDGELSVQALKAAFTAVVDRHESLRTIFAEVDGEPRQQILSAYDLPFDLEDLSGANPSDVMQKASEEARRPFKLDQDPLVRVKLLRLSPQAHIALVTIHHIVSDGWSTGIILNEISRHYAAFATGGVPDLQPLEIQYADYAIWQRQRLDHGEIARLAEFWKKQLEGAPHSLALPLDFPRPAVRSDMGASESLPLDPAVMVKVAEFAKTHQATPFIVLSAAWAALLSRWSGQDDIVIGTPIANRSQARTEDLIGFFVNTIALRADLSGAPSFAALVDRMRTRALDAYAHAELPFDKLVEALNPERGTGQHPIFQTMVAFQPGLPAPGDFGGLKVSPMPLSENAAKFDLTLVMRESVQGYAGAITYARDLFKPQTMQRLAEQFMQLLTSALSDPSRRIDQLLLSRAHQHSQVTHLSQPFARAIDIDTIGHLFERQVMQRPEAEGVSYGKVRLSFGEVNRRANRLAHRLIAMGVGPEQPVGVLLERSEALVIAALGIMKAGGVYTPVDPAHPSERIATIFDQVRPALVLTEAATATILAAEVPSLRIDLFDWATGPDHNPGAADLLAPLRPDHLAYIIHTSGSTGQPKGVGVSHAALANLAGARLQHDPIGPGDRVLASLSVSFDVSVGQLVTPLLQGATVVVAGNVAAMSPAAFWQLMVDEAITHLNSGPAFLDAVLESAPSSLPLRRLMLGGEPFPTSLAYKIQTSLPQVELFNMYGPTEACIDTTFYRFTGQELSPTLPIGQPLPNYRVLVLDTAMQVVPVGIPGELFIGGASLARGYLGRDQETAERFVENPFVPGERLYRTGDLGRWNDRGEIEFLGRADSQVKIRGFRIELDEIAAVLRAHPMVRSAAVTTYLRDGQAVLVAYVITDPGADDRGLAGWHAYLAPILPSYMLPAAVMVVPHLPMTVNGKLDLKALPEPCFEEAGNVPYAPPRHTLDEALIDIWSTLLSRSGLGIEDNFFKIGGHSLLALRVVAACKSKLGIDIPIAALYRHQTIRTFADAIHSGRAAKARGTLVGLGEGEGAPVFAFHPVGGGAFGYLGLATALAGKRPVFGVQARGLEAGESLAASIDEMVSEYVAAIRAQQPVGPYSFIGHSFGGLVAFEVTRRFEAEGEKVDRLVMLDTSALAATGAQETTTATPDKVADLELMYGKNQHPPVDADQVQRVRQVVANNMRLSHTCRPDRVRAPLIYVLATRSNLPDDGRCEFWKSRSDQPIDHPPLDCDHYAVLNAEHVSQLAGLFDETDKGASA